jgi:dephospho-CoA kinase
MSKSNLSGRIGVAGYMGAGKSSLAALLSEARGMRHIDADAEAKILMENDGRLRDDLALLFGHGVVIAGTVDFAALGKITFSSTEEMKKLNNLVHPPLVRRLRDLVFSQPGPCVLDAALIPFWHIEDWFDRCVWVQAAQGRRLQRVLAATGLPEEAVRERMRIQETLMTEPSGPNWLFVNNEGTLADLTTAAGTSL